MELRLAVISVFLVASVLSGPVKNLNSHKQCAVQCTSKNKFSYRVGTIYEYAYETETKTGIQGATEEQGGLKITATAEIEVLSKCELLLTVKNSNILGSDPDYPRQFKQNAQRGEFQKQLEDYSLRFSFQDGVVEELCPNDKDSDWSLNFKRGMLTAFQNSMDSFDMETEVRETDVSGQCQTSYRVTQEGWRTIKVKKTKDLLTCTNRHGFQTSAQATIYSVLSTVQSLPLLKSTQECDQVLSTEGRVESTVCHEIHLFRPFAKDNNGAMTEVVQKLTFVTEKRGGRPISGIITKRESLLYKHYHTHSKTSNNKDAAINKLTELCTTTKDGITPQTPRLFTELVHILKELNSQDLTDVYEQSQMESFCIDNNERVKKFYSDAVPMIGTTAAVKQIAKLILRNEITGRMAEIWLSSLSLVQNPSLEMLQEISKLMDLPEGTRVYLPASVIVNTYCRENENCENVPEVEEIISKLQKAVGSSCIVTEGNYLQVLTSLRAIGNLEFADKLVPTINECIAKKTNEMEIRVTAVEAFRRMSCGADRNNLMILYRDDREDSELRIAAYIQVMKCPNEYIISQVKDTLASEEVNQVGSFVWTHLTNLMETSSLHKHTIQNILEDETLKKEFDLDKRKFSRNYEWSYFSESMNAGTEIESNIVWSQKSFVPRSAMVNLTVDLFGHSVNLFEIGGRVEGLEKILADNFGPKGYFGAKQEFTPKQKLSNVIDFNKVQQIDEKLGKTDDDMKGSAYMRMFGNEISYYNTKQSAGNSIPNGDKPFNFLDMFMNLAKEQKLSQKMSKILMDSAVITPTVTGLPLSLKVLATSTIDLNAKSKIDLRNPSKKVIMEGSMTPSGAVEVSSIMSIDAFVTKSGLKMTSTFHTSTAVTAKFELDNKQEMTMEFNIPKEKSEIVNMKSQFFIVHASVEKEQKMITRNVISKKTCSGATLARVTGVEFCVDMSIPGDEEKTNAPHFPLTGPSKFALSVLKRDSHTSYKFELKNIMNKNKAIFIMMYDTPGSKIMRKTGFDFEIDHQNQKMEMNMVSPWKTAKFEGNLVNNPKRKKVIGSVTIDSSKKYQAEALVSISETKSTKTYKSKLEILQPNADPINFGANIVYKPGKVMTSKVALIGAFEKPASLDLSVRFTKFQYGMTGTLLFNKDQRYNADVNLDINKKGKKTIYTPRLIFAIPEKEYINFYGTVELGKTKGKIVRFDLVLSKLFKQPIKLKGDATKLVKGKRNIHKGGISFFGPRKISTKVRYLYDKKLRATKTFIKLDYNLQKLFSNLKDSLQFNSKLLKKSVRTSQRIRFNSYVKSARFSDYNHQINLNIETRPNAKIDADFIIDYGKTYMSKVNKHRLSVLTSTKYNIKPKSSTINYNITFQLPAEKLDSYFSGTHKYTKKEMKSNLHIRYDNKKSADISVNLMNLSKKYFKYSGDVALKYAGRHIQVSGQAVEKEKEYNTKCTIQHQVGHTSVFHVAYSWPNAKKREIASTIKIDQQLPVTITGSAMLNKNKPEGTFKVKVGKQFYVISGTGNYNGETYVKGLGKISYPSRQIMLDMEGGLKNDLYSGKFDVNWDVRDKKRASRVFVQGSFRNNTVEDFAISAQTIYPGRELSASIQHYSMDKIDTTVSVGWNKDQAISTTIKFAKEIKKYRSMVEGSVSLTTPFIRLQEFEIGGNHEMSKKKLAFGSTFTWNKGKTLAFQYDTKRPVDISDLAMNLHLKTPYSKIGNPTIKIQNTLSDDLIQQQGNVKVTWGNNQYIAIDTNGNTMYQGPQRKLKTNVGVKTSFDNYRVITLNFTHEDDLQKFLSKAEYVKDGVKYLYILNMDHMLDGWSMQNTGTFDISSPYDSLKIVWSHKTNDKDLETIVDTEWGRGQKFYAKATGSMETFPNRKYKANLELRIPSSEFSTLNIGLEHEDKVGFVKTVGKIIANRENIGTVMLNYARQLGSTDFDFRILSKYMKDFIIDGRTRHAHMPITGSLKVEWMTMKKISLDGSLNYNKIGTLDSKVELTTPFQRAKRVILKATHKLEGLDWVAESELEFAPMQKINAEVRYNTGLTKLVRLQITTPFPQFQKLNTGAYLKFVTYPDQWENKIDLEIVPLVRKISSVTTWQHSTITKGTFRLDTPFQSIRYMSAEVESKMIFGKRNSKLMFEYLPTQKIEMTSTYMLTNGNEFDGSISLKTPYNNEVFALYHQEGYSRDQLRGFKQRVQLKYSRTQNIIIDTTFGTKPKLFGSMEIEMPVRGYETVKLSFTHRGKKWKNFQTTMDYETNGKKIEFETLFDIVDDIRGKLKLTSPFSMKIAQIEYSHEGSPTNFKTHAGAIYNDFIVNSDAVFTHSVKQTTGSFSFKSPIEGAKDIMLSFNKDGTWKKLAFNGEAGYESGSKYIVVVKHSLIGKDAATDIVIQNPLTEDIIMKVSYDNRKKGFATTILRGSVGTDNSAILETTYKLKNYNFDLQMDLTTVISGEKHVSNLEYEHKGKLNDFTCIGSLKTSYNNMDERMKITFKGTDIIDDFDGSFEFKDAKMPISMVTGLRSHRANNKIVSEAKYNDNVVKTEVNIEDRKYKGKINVVTKIEGYENLELDFNHVGETNRAVNKITIKPFTHKPATLEADLQFTGITSFGADLKFTSDFEGFEIIESKIKHNGNLKDFNCNFEFKKSKMVPIKLEASLNAIKSSNIDGSFLFTSGISGAEKIEGSLKHRGDVDDMSSVVIVKTLKNKPVQINLVFVKNLPEKLLAKMTFASGLEGAENLEISFDRLHRRNELSQKTVLNLPRMKPITIIQKFNRRRTETELVYQFTSGIIGMENVQMTMVHDGRPKNFVNTITLHPPYMNNEGMKLISKLDMDDDYTNINGDVRFVSGMKGAEDVHVSLTHNGPYDDFSNKLVIHPPFMEEMDLSTVFKFVERQTLQMSLDFNSKINGAETLGFSLDGKLIDDKKVTSQTEIKLDRLRKIVLDLEGMHDIKDDGSIEFLTKFDLITPFEQASTVNCEYGSEARINNGRENMSSKEFMSFSLNGKKYWDTLATTETIKGQSGVYNYNMEQPRQMECNVNVQFGEPYSADVILNWDKMEPNSNIKIESKLENMNDLKIKVVHPKRSVGLEGAFTNGDEKNAKMVVTWDEDKNQAVGMEAKWQDQNRRGLDILDGSIKVITPFRAVEASGSVNKVLSRKSIEGTVFWDAEKDRTKKVSVRTEMTPDSNGYSGTLLLSLPVIDKELMLTRQLTENEGNVLYEARTEFSYSSDPSKTIIFTTKLEDLSEFGSTNHSYTIGVSQAFTRVDTSISTHVGRSKDKDSVGMLIKYQTSLLQKKNLLLLAEIDKLEKKIILQSVGPESSGGVIGQMHGTVPVTVSIRGLHGWKDAVETDITIDNKKKAMEIKMKYDKDSPNNVLHIAAKYPSKTNLDVQIYRTGDKPQITDAVIKVNLRTSRILHSKINWRPQALQDLMNVVVQTVEKYGKLANDKFVSTTNDMERELTTKYTAISSELETELKPYIDSLSNNLLAVQNRLNKIKKHLDKMYKENEMYMKDVTDGVRQKTTSAIEIYKKAVIKMKKTIHDLRAKVDKLKDLKNYAFKKKYKELVTDVASKIQTFKEKTVEMLKKETETITKKMKATVESLRKDIQEMTDKIRKKLIVLLDGVLEKAEIKELMSYVDDVLKYLPDSTNMPEIKWEYYIKKIHASIKNKLSKLDLAKSYDDVIETTKTAITNQLEPIMQDEKVQELKELADNLQKKLRWAYKRWNIEKTIKSYLIELYNELQTYIKEDIAALKFLHWDKNRIIAFDPENGKIEFEIYLPTPADTLESLPKFKLHKYIKSIDTAIKKIDSLEMPQMFDFNIWDFYYKYKPSWNPKDWVPPFNSFALVAGYQHFITFDQRQIDFAGRCSYVLAKDMVGNKFTVILNYNGKRRPEMKSLLVLSEGKSVEIFPDFSVKLDNRPTELPIKHQKLSVIRDGNLIQVNTGRGLVISGNLANQHIAFVLSGWYFGKVGGLLGSYDNEQYDDMIDSTGQVTKDINVTAQTWEVASRCRNSANLASNVKVEAGKKGYLKCSKLFIKSDSTLRPCFKIVNTAYFMKVCMAEMQTSKGDGCNAVSAYVKQCRQNDVMLWEPKTCITCSAPNKELYEGGESIKLSPSSDDYQVPKSADVVMVVEQMSCNTNPAKHLGDLVDKLEQAFKKKGITDNRYGLIGFGGTARPGFGRKTASVAHTFEGGIFSEANKFAKGKETLKFGYHFTDPLEAIMRAADMPFRAGVSKTIVLLHCGECSESKIVNYNHLKHVLSTRDITLHIIREQDIRFKGNRSPKDVIMGFDNSKKYMMKPVDNMATNDVNIPQDSCASLSLNTDGSLFISAGLTDSKLRNRKWFLNTVSKRISETALPDECQVCQCVADHTGMAKAICRKCYSSISDYLPNWWSTVRHPNKIQNQFEKQYKDYFGDDSWTMFDV